MTIGRKAWSATVAGQPSEMEPASPYIAASTSKLDSPTATNQWNFCTGAGERDLFTEYELIRTYPKPGTSRTQIQER